MTDWERFWHAYPLKVGKKDAQRAWDRAKDKPPIENILEAIRRAQRSKRWVEGFVPNPATWLNQGRWDDELPLAVEPPKPKALRLVERTPVERQEYEPPPAEFWEKVGRIGKSI
jgi:hypothetical protein